MYDDTVVSFSHPEKISIDDPLTEVLRAGASRLLIRAVEAEVQAFLAAHEHLVDDAGRRRVVRHGHMPEREVQTGIGPVAVRRPRVRDRQPGGEGDRIRFTSAILPPYLRRTRSVEELLPWLYLKGISTGDFPEALRPCSGPTRQASRRARSLGPRRPGRKNTSTGAAAIFRPNAMSTSGPTASTSARAWIMTSSACW